MLAEHVERFNEAVRSGDYGPMLAAFAPMPRCASRAWRSVLSPGGKRSPPRTPDSRRATRSMLLTEPRVERDTEESDYAWKSEGTRAGRMILTALGGKIARLVVTFE